LGLCRFVDVVLDGPAVVRHPEPWPNRKGDSDMTQIALTIEDHLDAEIENVVLELEDLEARWTREGMHVPDEERTRLAQLRTERARLEAVREALSEGYEGEA